MKLLLRETSLLYYHFPVIERALIKAPGLEMFHWLFHYECVLQPARTCRAKREKCCRSQSFCCDHAPHFERRVQNSTTGKKRVRERRCFKYFRLVRVIGSRSNDRESEAGRKMKRENERIKRRGKNGNILEMIWIQRFENKILIIMHWKIDWTGLKYESGE